MFAPGDEVVCIRGGGFDRGYGDEALPIRGQHYTVREVLCATDGRIRLVEIANPVRRYVMNCGRVLVEEPAFLAARFRPVRREAIEVFRAMCVSNKPLVDVESHLPASLASIKDRTP